MGKTILITSGRSINALGLARQFHEAGHRVITIDTMQWHMCRFSKTIAKNYTIPSPRSNEKEYVEKLIDIVKKECVDWVIPIYEEIVYLCKYRERFPSTCHIFAPTWEMFSTLHNKWLFTLKLQEMGIETPETYLLKTEEDLHQLDPGQSYAIKPIFSRASLDLKKKVPNGPMPKVSIKAPNYWIAQKWLLGKQYCSYSLCHEGELKAHTVYPVGFTAEGKGCIVFKSILHQEIFQWIKKVVKNLNFTGQIAFDFVETEKKLFAIECNPRSTNGSLLFRGHTNLSKAFLNESQKIITPEVCESRQIFIAMLMYGWRKTSLPDNSFGNFIKEASLKKDVIFDRKDLRPFFLQPLTLAEIVFYSLKNKMSLPAVYIHDYEYNGEREHEP